MRISQHCDFIILPAFFYFIGIHSQNCFDTFDIFLTVMQGFARQVLSGGAFTLLLNQDVPVFPQNFLPRLFSLLSAF